ncbi:serine/threonine-protein kinase [Streptomyces sp. NBC_01104]|uniref:serine/threonine-protein kinase n=1 Tax=Streptomyces sp. NBC_01104 TaxID=2903750 RepID=UPI003869EA62|nr:serine/threonine protein kinase [Streptomyces sp. NBC_01104]
MRLAGRDVGGRYRKETRLARGRDEVWVAHDTVLDRKVTLARIRFRDGGLREAGAVRSLARIRHPHLAALYDTAAVHRDEAWVAMEYVPGVSLADRPRMSLGEAARIGADVAGALAALHREGWVHTGVRPGNIVITADGTARLTGLHAAHRVRDPLDDSTLTGDVHLSNPGFGAPESLSGYWPEAASDVFSVGATVYTLVTGVPLYRDEDVEEFRSGWMAEPGAVSLPEDVGPLRQVLSALLQRHPGRRLSALGAQRQLAAAAEQICADPTADAASPLVVLYDPPPPSPPKELPEAAPAPLPAAPPAVSSPQPPGPLPPPRRPHRLGAALLTPAVAAAAFVTLAVTPWTPLSHGWWLVLWAVLCVILTRPRSTSPAHAQSVTPRRRPHGPDGAPSRRRAVLLGLLDLSPADVTHRAAGQAGPSVEELLRRAYDELGPPPGFAHPEPDHTDAGSDGPTPLGDVS